MRSATWDAADQGRRPGVPAGLRALIVRRSPSTSVNNCISGIQAEAARVFRQLVAPAARSGVGRLKRPKNASEHRRSPGQHIADRGFQ
jgi:hypothetical protein